MERKISDLQQPMLFAIGLVFYFYTGGYRYYLGDSALDINVHELFRSRSLSILLWTIG